MCKQGLLVDLDDFNVTEFYQKHQQSRVRGTHAPSPQGDPVPHTRNVEGSSMGGVWECPFSSLLREDLLLNWIIGPLESVGHPPWVEVLLCQRQK